MFISVRRYKVNPADVPEITKRAQEGFVPIMKGSPGFVAYYGVDHGNGDVATVSIFESQEQAEASNNRAAGWVKENLASLVPNPPEIITGDILWAEMK